MDGTCQAPLSFTISWSLLKFMSVELPLPSNHLFLCRPLLLLASVFPSINSFVNYYKSCVQWDDLDQSYQTPSEVSWWRNKVLWLWYTIQEKWRCGDKCGSKIHVKFFKGPQGLSTWCSLTKCKNQDFIFLLTSSRIVAILEDEINVL